MTTVVQTTYRPQVRKAVNGMVADLTGAEVATRLCETSGGIGFGLAVSQGSNDKGCVLGGYAFYGVTVRDVVQDTLPLDPLAADGTYATVDTYPQRANMGILTRGHLWVAPDTEVAAGDALYYDVVTGKFGNSASGKSAYGTITFSGQPSVDDTITFNGTTITFKATNATSAQCNIGNTLGHTLENLASRLNGLTGDSNVNVATYDVDPPSPGGAGQGSGATTLTISYDTPGEGGNAYTLAKSCSVATLSGATLSGGDDGTEASGYVTFTQQPANGATVTLNGTVTTFGDGTGAYATGNIVFSEQPADGSKITLNGVDVTFGAGQSVAIGIDLATTVDSLVSYLSGSVNAQISKCTYAARGTPHDGVNITSKTKGLTMNAFTLVAGTSPASHGTVSGAHLTGGLVAGDVTIGGTLAQSIDALVSYLSSSIDAQVAKCTYVARGTPHSGVTITSKTVGPTMNAFTIAVSDTNGSASGATLSGGIAASVAVPYGYWVTSADINELAIISLGAQR